MLSHVDRKESDGVRKVSDGVRKVYYGIRKVSDLQNVTLLTKAYLLKTKIFTQDKTHKNHY